MAKNISLNNFENCSRCGKIIQKTDGTEMCIECYEEYMKEFKYGWIKCAYKSKWSEFLPDDILDKYVVGGSLVDSDLAGTWRDKMEGR